MTALPNGAVWLRATPTIDDYSDDRIQKVFETLAPVLITGRVTFGLLTRKGGRLVEGADAADYQ
jgi:hypothetical protein